MEEEKKNKTQHKLTSEISNLSRHLKLLEMPSE
jgi:hypothetical protein